MSICRRTFLAFALLPIATAPRASAIDAPNVVPISDLLVTSGQPTAETLARLGAAGFQAVIYLAPATVHTAVREEGALLANQGIEFVHVPIPFGNPNEGHFREVTAALQRLKDKKVLVHCEVNMRASSMVFLHRVVTLKDDPDAAYAFVNRVWSPRGPWRTLIEEQLRKSGIRFELL